MSKDRFEIEFKIDPDKNYGYELTALNLANELCIEAAENNEKGVILCQVHVYEHDRAEIIGRFIKKECALEITSVMKKYGYETSVDDRG